MDVLRARVVGQADIPASVLRDVRQVHAKFWATSSERSLVGLRTIDLDDLPSSSLVSGGLAPRSADTRASLNALPGIRRLLKDTFDLTGLRAAFLVETAPFKGLHPHSHEPRQAERVLRVHIPLITNSRSLFGERHQAFRIYIGTAVVLERAELHWEFNSGQDECVRLVCDFDPDIVPLSRLLKRPASDGLQLVERQDLPGDFSSFFHQAAMNTHADRIEELLIVADVFFMRFAVKRYPSPWDLLTSYFQGRPDCIEALHKLGQQRQLVH